MQCHSKKAGRCGYVKAQRTPDNRELGRRVYLHHRLSYRRAIASQLVSKDPNTWRSERNGDLEPPIVASSYDQEVHNHFTSGKWYSDIKPPKNPFICLGPSEVRTFANARFSAQKLHVSLNSNGRPGSALISTCCERSVFEGCAGSPSSDSTPSCGQGKHRHTSSSAARRSSSSIRPEPLDQFFFFAAYFCWNFSSLPVISSFAFSPLHTSCRMKSRSSFSSLRATGK